MKSLTEFIKKQNLNLRTYYVNGILVQEPKHDKSINFRTSIERSLSYLPKHFLSAIKQIKIGLTDMMISRQIQAYYDKGTIYLTDQQSSENDLMDDLIHEIAHSVEELYHEEIYQDRTIEREFLYKRKKLYQILKQKGYTVDPEVFNNPDYDVTFDEFLYKTVGYKKLSHLVVGIYYSPYAATSLREYFANAFEAIFYENKINIIKSISPAIYSKMEKISNEDRRENNQ